MCIALVESSTLKGKKAEHFGLSFQGVTDGRRDHAAQFLVPVHRYLA